MNLRVVVLVVVAVIYGIVIASPTSLTYTSVSGWATMFEKGPAILAGLVLIVLTVAIALEVQPAAEDNPTAESEV